jgi:hypothetical protein
MHKKKMEKLFFVRERERGGKFISFRVLTKK